MLSCVKVVDVKRKRTIGISRRTISKDYSLLFENKVIKVCFQFILSTLNITKKFFYYTTDNASPYGLSKMDQRGKHLSNNKKTVQIMKYIDTFIQKLPAVQSHYCRASSSRKYLPTEFGNLSRLYELNVFDCKNNEMETVSKSIFRNIFLNKYNIGFHTSKKDKCRFCSKYENIENIRKLTDDEQHLKNKHEKEKKDTKKMFLSDQDLSKAGGNHFICASFDLQKILNTPQGQNMNLYYGRKYNMFNLTIYESCT